MYKSPRRKRSSQLLSSLALLLIGLVVVRSNAEAQESSGVPKEVQGVGVEQKLGNEIPGDLPFVDESGKKVFLGQLFDGKRPSC